MSQTRISQKKAADHFFHDFWYLEVSIYQSFGCFIATIMGTIAATNFKACLRCEQIIRFSPRRLSLLKSGVQQK